MISVSKPRLIRSVSVCSLQFDFAINSRILRVVIGIISKISLVYAI